jgi:hypothetical protein
VGNEADQTLVLELPEGLADGDAAHAVLACECLLTNPFAWLEVPSQDELPHPIEDQLTRKAVSIPA